MRLVTYIGLVARRVWSRKGILIGSLLGATLVIALLVVLPLYEASVQAVDLRFTLANAPADDVDVTAFSQTTSYDDVIATDNRELVVTTWQDQIAPWYPTVLERTQSREFVVIPIDGSVDWMGQAAAWREEIGRLRDAEVDPEEFPPPPYPTPPQEATQARMMTAPDIVDRVVVVAGEWPGATVGLPAGGPAPDRDPWRGSAAGGTGSSKRRGPAGRGSGRGRCRARRSPGTVHGRIARRHHRAR